MKTLNFLLILIVSIAVASCSKDEDTIIENQNSLTDIDGNIYKTVEIGEQIWMAENLKVTNYPDGTPILLVTENSIWTGLEDNDSDEAYCFYNNKESESHGALYTYSASKKACPTGWHLPSDEEWKQLEIFLGMSPSEADSLDFRGTGNVLKSTSGWNNDGNGSNVYGFAALPGGIRDLSTGNFESFGEAGLWWTSTEVENHFAYYRHLMTSPNSIIRLKTNKSFGLSVRCIKDKQYRCEY